MSDDNGPFQIKNDIFTSNRDDGHFLKDHFGRNNNHFGGFGQNRTALGQRRRASGLNWTVQKTKIGQSAKVDGPDIKIWTTRKQTT